MARTERERNGQPTLYAWVDGTTMEIVKRRRGGLISSDDERVVRYVDTHQEPLDSSSIDESMQRYANQRG